jgi:hypothetical protein
MEKNLESVRIAFNDKANKYFFFLYDQFGLATRRLDSFKDNNVFQQLLGRYLVALKHQLEFLATECIENNKHIEQLTELRRILAETVSDLMGEFTRKARSFGS